MESVRYDGKQYLVSDTGAVFLVHMVNGKTNWTRVYDRTLSGAVRDQMENEDARHKAHMAEQDSFDMERPGLW